MYVVVRTFCGGGLGPVVVIDNLDWGPAPAPRPGWRGGGGRVRGGGIGLPDPLPADPGGGNGDEPAADPAPGVDKFRGVDGGGVAGGEGREESETAEGDCSPA